MKDDRLERWHKVIFEKDMALLHDLLAEQVEFHSPTVWKPKQGRDITAYILSMVIEIFEDFEYHHEWIDNNSFALEFSAKIDGKNIKGVDLIHWDDEGQIKHFEVMMRPINGLNLMYEKMTEHLKEAGFI
ncbi:nuclear transport factor 2 family protein [Pseudomaricurvus sp.]|uniref:nuclear transport factor 2 family protein n=1 Tax=Pseudomaricurvus sp. TaxID=2004510 RepID=UPI003F6D1018